MDKFISYLCLEVITWDWDGYPMNRNNYRIYHDPKTRQDHLHPLGHGPDVRRPQRPAVPRLSGTVARAVMETPEGRERYLKRMDEIMKKVYVDEKQRLDELEKRFSRRWRRSMRAGRDFPNQVKRLGDLIKGAGQEPRKATGEDEEVTPVYAR